jgi:hypothetical protein
VTVKEGTSGVAASVSRHVYGPRAVSALLPAITRPALKKHGPALGSLVADWEAVVGPELARQTEPMKLAQGTLTLGCAGPVALEMQHLAPQILERVNAHLSNGAAVRLRLVQRTSARAAVPPPARPIPKRAQEQAEAAVATLPDGPLRDALRSLGEAVLARSVPSTRRGGAA